MSIENITEKIIGEAENIADSSLNNANSQSLKIIDDAKKRGETMLAEAFAQNAIEAETLKSRKVSAAELQTRKMLLIAKQDAIKKSFDIALEKLKNMPEHEYINFLAGEIQKIPDCSGEIILTEKDKNNIGEKLIKTVNENLKGNQIALSSKTIQASGGFVLKNGDVEINSTFETILSSIKDELTFEVANALFK